MKKINPNSLQEDLLTIAFIDHLYFALLDAVLQQDWSEPLKTRDYLHRTNSPLVAEILGREISKIKYNRLGLNEEETLFARNLIKDLVKFLELVTYTTSSNRNSIVKNLKNIKKGYKKQENLVFKVAVGLSLQSNIIIDKLLSLMRWLTLNSKYTSLSGSKYGGYNELVWIITINNHGYMTRPDGNYYKLLLDKYIFEYFILSHTKFEMKRVYKNKSGIKKEKVNEVYQSKFRPTKKEIELYIKYFKVSTTGAFNNLTKVDDELLHLYDMGLPIINYMATEMKTIYFNYYSPLATALSDVEHTRFTLSPESFRLRNKIIPEEGLIVKIYNKEGKKLMSEMEVKEVHDSGHYMIIKYKTALDNEDYYVNILTLDMENCDYVLPLGTILPITIFLNQLGIPEEDLFRSLNSNNPEYQEYREEVIKTKEGKNLLVEDGTIFVEYEIPDSWNYKTKPCKTTTGERKDKTNVIKHWITVHTRKINGEASEEAQRLAKRFFINLDKGLTIVKPHTRRYYKGGD